MLKAETAPKPQPRAAGASKASAVPSASVTSTGDALAGRPTLQWRGGQVVGVKGAAPEWFGPGDALLPVAPAGVGGRAFDYPVHSNVSYTPRGEAGFDGVDFPQLRTLADSLDILRLMIETRKDQVGKLKWNLKGEDGKPAPEAKAKKVRELLKRPDGVSTFDEWLRRLLEDLFVIDAPAVYVNRTVGGAVLSFEPIDGATVKRLIDAGGRTPKPPDPAYQQILKGLPAADLTTDDLLYSPRNLRTSRLYGYSPTEQILLTVNIALRRQTAQLSFFTEGTLPEAIVGVPETWTAEQLEQFQNYWDGALTGNLAERSKVRFVPGGMKSQTIQKDDLSGKFDEWLARVIAFAFSVSPQGLVAQMNRATAETAHQQAIEEGLAPIMLWVENLVNRMISDYLKVEGVLFAWEDEESVDPLESAQVDQILVNTGILTKNEAREKRGLPPLPDPPPRPAPPIPPLLPSGATPNPEGPAPADPVPPQPQGGGEPIPAAGKPAAPKKKAPADAPGLAQAPASKAASVEAGADQVQKNDGEGRGILPSTAAPASPPVAAGLHHHARIAKADTPAQAAALKKIQALVKKWLRAQVSKVASQITGAVGKIGKDAARELESKVEEALQAIGLQGDVLKKALADVLATIYQGGVEEALAKINAAGSWATDALPAGLLEQVNEKAAEWASDHAAELVTNIETSTRDFIRNDVSAAVTDGLSTASLQELLTENYAFSDLRAETIARTELAFANVQGNLETYRESGVVSQKEWIVGAECCDECDELDGMTVDLEDDFPGAGSGPPFHPNCRCDVLPVVSAEPDQPEPDTTE